MTNHQLVALMAAIIKGADVIAGRLYLNAPENHGSDYDFLSNAEVVEAAVDLLGATNDYTIEAPEPDATVPAPAPATEARA